MVFGEYARYYDDLYADKNYPGECDYLEKLISTHSAKPVNSILDMGCGTGGHLIPLSKRGYFLTGVDCSEEMLAITHDKISRSEISANLVQGDIRNIDLNKTFDLVISMFAVMNYQVSNDDLIAAFRTARRHLKPGGLFVFDGWFGPAILAIRPEDRIKVIKKDGERLFRLAHSEIDAVEHIVRVNYTIFRLRGQQVIDEVEEWHLMRYFFIPEIDLLCRMAGFQLIQCCPFLDSGRKPVDTDWNVTWVARAV
jgi:SAM-dependent methyltransferase